MSSTITRSRQANSNPPSTHTRQHTMKNLSTESELSTSEDDGSGQLVRPTLRPGRTRTTRADSNLNQTEHPTSISTRKIKLVSQHDTIAHKQSNTSNQPPPSRGHPTPQQDLNQTQNSISRRTRNRTNPQPGSIAPSSSITTPSTRSTTSRPILRNRSSISFEDDSKENQLDIQQPQPPSLASTIASNNPNNPHNFSFQTFPKLTPEDPRFNQLSYQQYTTLDQTTHYVPPTVHSYFPRHPLLVPNDPSTVFGALVFRARNNWPMDLEQDWTPFFYPQQITTTTTSSDPNPPSSMTTPSTTPNTIRPTAASNGNSKGGQGNKPASASTTAATNTSNSTPSASTTQTQKKIFIDEEYTRPGCTQGITSSFWDFLANENPKLARLLQDHYDTVLARIETEQAMNDNTTTGIKHDDPKTGLKTKGKKQNDENSNLSPPKGVRNTKDSHQMHDRENDDDEEEEEDDDDDDDDYDPMDYEPYLPEPQILMTDTSDLCNISLVRLFWDPAFSPTVPEDVLNQKLERDVIWPPNSTNIPHDYPYIPGPDTNFCDYHIESVPLNQAMGDMSKGAGVGAAKTNIVNTTNLPINLAFESSRLLQLPIIISNPKTVYSRAEARHQSTIGSGSNSQHTTPLLKSSLPSTATTTPLTLSPVVSRPNSPKSSQIPSDQPFQQPTNNIRLTRGRVQLVQPPQQSSTINAPTLQAPNNIPNSQSNSDLALPLSSRTRPSSANTNATTRMTRHSKKALTEMFTSPHPITVTDQVAPLCAITAEDTNAEESDDDYDFLKRDRHGLIGKDEEYFVPKIVAISSAKMHYEEFWDFLELDHKRQRQEYQITHPTQHIIEIDCSNTQEAFPNPVPQSGPRESIEGNSASGSETAPETIPLSSWGFKLNEPLPCKTKDAKNRQFCFTCMHTISSAAYTHASRHIAYYQLGSGQVKCVPCAMAFPSQKILEAHWSNECRLPPQLDKNGSWASVDPIQAAEHERQKRRLVERAQLNHLCGTWEGGCLQKVLNRWNNQLYNDIYPSPVASPIGSKSSYNEPKMASARLPDTTVANDVNTHGPAVNNNGSLPSNISLLCIDDLIGVHPDPTQLEKLREHQQQLQTELNLEEAYCDDNDYDSTISYRPSHNQPLPISSLLSISSQLCHQTPPSTLTTHSFHNGWTSSQQSQLQYRIDQDQSASIDGLASVYRPSPDKSAAPVPSASSPSTSHLLTPPTQHIETRPGVESSIYPQASHTSSTTASTPRRSTRTNTRFFETRDDTSITTHQSQQVYQPTMTVHPSRSIAITATVATQPQSGISKRGVRYQQTTESDNSDEQDAEQVKTDPAKYRQNPRTAHYSRSQNVHQFGNDQRNVNPTTHTFGAMMGRDRDRNYVSLQSPSQCTKINYENNNNKDETTP